MKLKYWAMGMAIPLTAAVALLTAPAASATPVASFQRVVRADSNWRDRSCDPRWDRGWRASRCHRDDNRGHRGR